MAACYQLASTTHFEDRFYTSKKGGVGRGRQVSAWDAMGMAATLAGCRSLGWHWLDHFFTLLAQMAVEITNLPLYELNHKDCLLIGER